MSKLGDFVKSADWNSEKHAPVIEAPASAKAGEFVDVTASTGKAIAHPNTTEHHIAWIALNFLPEGAASTVEIGRCEFSAHGQDVKGPNEGPLHTDSLVSTRIKLATSGTIFATSYCNIHGLWESSQSITIEA
jgi:superoxide reductase